MKYLTHWSTAFITLVLLTYIGLQDSGFKETLRLKSFDFVLANEEKSQSKDITIITIDEEAIEKLNYFKHFELIYKIILELRTYK